MAIATPNADQVSQNIQMRMLLDNGATALMPCTLTYSLSDPYAVSATFRSTQASVTWVFARELLEAGLLQRCGDGDIKITPVRRSSGSFLRIELCSPDGRAVMESPSADIEAFLSHSRELLPTGLEWTYLNLDAELEQLLKDEVA